MTQLQNEEKIKAAKRVKRIRWGVAAFFFIVLAVIYALAQQYLYATVTSELSNAYLTLSLAFLLVWFIGIIVFLLYMILKYQPIDNEHNPYISETLGLPPGTLRAILTLTLLIAVVLLEGYALTNMDKADAIQKILNPLITAFQLMIAFYFGTKMVGMVSGDKKTPTQKPKG